MKKLLILCISGALISISIALISHYHQDQPPVAPDKSTVLDTLVAAHIISAPSAEEEAKRIKAFSNEPPLTQKDIDTFLSLIPKFSQALSNKAEIGRILHQSGFSAMRFQYVGAKLGIATGAIVKGGQQAETLLTQTQMPPYLRPTAPEMVLIKKNKDVLKKYFTLSEDAKKSSSTPPPSASEEAKQIADFQKEPPFTQGELDSFIEIITQSTKAEFDPAKVAEIIIKSNLPPERVIYIQTKVGLIISALNQGGKEQVHRMQSKTPKHLRATPNELDLVIKNKAAINNMYLESATALFF